jgi:hypothetical protein
MIFLVPSIHYLNVIQFQIDWSHYNIVMQKDLVLISQGAAEYLKISKPPFLGIDVAPDAYF